MEQSGIDFKRGWDAASQEWIKALNNPYFHTQMITPYGLGSGKKPKIECSPSCRMCAIISEFVPNFKEQE